jgi:biopolymer transport protein ExbD
MNSKKLGAPQEQAPTSRPGGVTGTSVTPLVDLLLVLLFAGLASAAVSRAWPAAASPPVRESPTPTTQVILELFAGGRYRLNGQLIPEAQLGQQLAAIYHTRPVKILFIRRGRERISQELLRATDLARGAGVTTIATLGD